VTTGTALFGKPHLAFWDCFRRSIAEYSAVQKDGFLRHAAIAAVIAVVFYLVFFNWMQHRREGKGPWQINFSTAADGTPSIDIRQPALHLSHRVIFDGAHLPQTNLHQTVQFYQGTADIPFGKMLFQDPTFLPGTVTMDLFGHQVEIIPRALIIDKKEHAWTEPDLHLAAK
jgi:hypothetical protein